jgi:hypothetical protein
VLRQSWLLLDQSLSRSQFFIDRVLVHELAAGDAVGSASDLHSTEPDAEGKSSACLSRWTIPVRGDACATANRIKAHLGEWFVGF